MRLGQGGAPGESLVRLSLLSSDETYRDLIFKEPRHFLYEYHPELSDYLWFHDALDRFVWLLRLRYSTRETLKTKQYRLDLLFQHFLRETGTTSLRASKNLIGRKHSKERFSYYLLQGWYNELAAAYPFVEDPISIGTSLNYSDAHWKVDLFPSWQIIKAYYSIYSYYNAFVFTNVSGINTFQHRKTTNHFNKTLLKKFSSYLLHYPFSLSDPLLYDLDTLRRSRKREWDFQYARFPRDLNKSLYDIEHDFIMNLKKLRMDLASQYPVSIIDLLYYFRIWANYLGGDTVVQLRSGGLLMFLERNLYITNFFIAGLCEILALAFLGENEYIKIFMEFYRGFIVEKETLYQKWFYIPQIVRLRIYKHLNIISRLPRGMKRPNNDIVRFL